MGRLPLARGYYRRIVSGLTDSSLVTIAHMPIHSRRLVSGLTLERAGLPHGVTNATVGLRPCDGWRDCETDTVPALVAGRLGKDHCECGDAGLKACPELAEET